MYYHYYKGQWPLCWPRFIVCLWFSVEPPTEFGYLCHHARITGACGKSSAVLWMCSYLNIIPPHPTLPHIDEHLGSAIDVLGLSSLLQLWLHCKPRWFSRLLYYYFTKYVLEDSHIYQLRKKEKIPPQISLIHRKFH